MYSITISNFQIIASILSFFNSYLQIKHTKIGNNCFVGSNSTIISPCELEDNSYIAGGSVIDAFLRNDGVFAE